MHTIMKVLLVALVLSLLVIPGVAYAQDPDYGDQVIFGSNFVLHSGETINGDLAVFGGSVSLEEGSQVKGDVVVFGGSLLVRGMVDGDIAVIGGSVQLDSTAVVTGDVSGFGGSINQSPGAEIKGSTVEGFRFDQSGGPEIRIPGIPPIPFGPDAVPEINITSPMQRGPFEWFIGYFLRGMSAIALAAILAALGVVLVVLFPKPTERVATTASENAVVSFGSGCLTLVLGIPLLILLAITICLIPLSVVLGVALIAAWVFGWLAVGWLLGKRLLLALNTENHTPVIEAVVGVAVLTLVWQLPGVVPCVGGFLSWLIGLVVGCIGLGAVMLSKFGTRTYGAPPPARTTPAGPQLPPPPASALPVVEED
ncbi:MAG: polymer-forming cytoskeletal protein [Caldilineales bacterium]|nr:polymer-forming cytoskeletal protein [Caldilineales bacterium]